jgi:hypothetical protein
VKVLGKCGDAAHFGRGGEAYLELGSLGLDLGVILLLGVRPPTLVGLLGGRRGLVTLERLLSQGLRKGVGRVERLDIVFEVLAHPHIPLRDHRLIVQVLN